LEYYVDKVSLLPRTTFGRLALSATCAASAALLALAPTGLQAVFFVLLTALALWSFDRRLRQEETLRQELARLEAAHRELDALRRTDDNLRATEHRFAKFMQHLPGLAWIKDLEGRYVYANDAAAKAFGRRREDLYGKADGELFPPATARAFQENDERALASGTGILTVETLEQEDGVSHSSIVSKFPIPGPDGAASLIGGMAIDITEQKRIEEALRQADRHKDEFLATLSHELRNPLAPICNGLELLRPAIGRDGGDAKAYEMIQRQVRQLVRLIDDLLDVARINTGKIALRMQRTELSAIIRDAVEASRPQIEAAGQDLQVTLPPGPVTLEGDGTRLAQVLLNLLNNASKFTGPAGQIRLTAEEEGGALMIRVRDSGIGIPPHMLASVFDLFTQVDRSPERSRGGLGVGLSLVRTLVEMHNGTVEAYSAGPGLGTEIEVRLPLPAGHDTGVAPRPADAAGAMPAPSYPLRVLVVDDNQDTAESLAALLLLKRHDVRTAYDGPTALQEAFEFRPDVLLLDLGLPGMSGYEVARLLREHEHLQGAVLIAVTGWGQDGDRRRTQEAGFRHHLVKPVAPAEIDRLLAGLGSGGG
jgi:PAS domain S-box-containing protein